MSGMQSSQDSWRGAAWCGVVRRGAECLTDEANKALLKQDH